MGHFIKTIFRRDHPDTVEYLVLMMTRSRKGLGKLLKIMKRMEI